jgi:hypothetical protein
MNVTGLCDSMELLRFPQEINVRENRRDNEGWTMQTLSA